jgi:hypothetical protein
LVEKGANTTPQEKGANMIPCYREMGPLPHYRKKVQHQKVRFLSLGKRGNVFHVYACNICSFL